MARKPTKGTAGSGVSITCNVCVATYQGEAYTVTQVRAEAAGKWGWQVTPSGHDLCGLCVKRGEMTLPEHQQPKGGK